MTSREISRRGEISRLMRRLELDGYPRLQMFFLVTLTGAAGLAASYVLLLSGLDSMLVRYPLAVGCAHLIFLLLLWMWLRTKSEDYASGDIPQSGSGSGSPPSTGGGREPVFSGGGGESSGGGASSSFDVNDSLPSPSVPGGDSIGTVGEAIGSADEAAVPLAVALAVAVVAAGLIFASLYIVYLAPALFAELLVDGALSASLYRHMRGLQTRHWLESALRRTVLPFIVTAITLGAIGYGFKAYAPQARTIGEVIQHFIGWQSDAEA